MAAVESNYNASEMLTEVNNAIYAVLVGGQSYNCLLYTSDAADEL